VNFLFWFHSFVNYLSLSNWVIIIINNGFGVAVVEIYYIIYNIDIYNINLLYCIYYI
jgi:hypothetical protein